MGPDPLPGGSTYKIFKGFPPLLFHNSDIFHFFILLHLEYLFYLFDSLQYQINGHNGSLRVLHPTTQKSCRSPLVLKNGLYALARIHEGTEEITHY